MIAKTIAAMAIVFSSFSFGQELNANSSWDSILSSNDIYLKYHELNVGHYKTDVFSVEHDSQHLYTKDIVDNGQYRLKQKGGERNQVWIQNKEKAKGWIAVEKPVYERVSVNGDNNNEYVFKGYKTHKEPLTRNIMVFSKASNKPIFQKEYTIKQKM